MLKLLNGRFLQEAIRLPARSDHVRPPMNKINLRPALAAMDHDEDILYAVVAAFTEEVPSLMHEFDQALAKNDQPVVERTSHTLKGNFRILQLQNLQMVWANIETLAHNDQLAQIPALVPEAKVVTQNVLEQLEAALASR